MKIEEITNEALDKVYNDVINDETYGKELSIVDTILNKHKKNTDLYEVATKVAIIDVTNSTHFSQYKSKINLDEISNFIIGIKDFDKRVEAGDPELVNELARNNGQINLFSFASKYCYYHNKCIYQKDSYAKYDGIVHDCLPEYLSKAKIKLGKKEVTPSTLNRLREQCDYASFNSLVDKVLENVDTDFKKAKFDYLMWFNNR